MAFDDLNRINAGHTAAPAGLPGAQAAATGGDGSFADLAAINAQPAWETGGQKGSTQNGWNTDFYDRMFKQRDQYSEKGNLAEWYGAEDFTGVATWDQQTKDRNVKFGDIYDKGVKVGNLLDGKSGYNEQEGYTMLAQLTMDAKEQQKAFENLQNNPNAVKEAVDARREMTTKEVSAAQTQGEYQSDIDELKDEWDDTATGWAAFGAGAAGGAAIGAGIGSVIPGLGTLAGGLIGGLVGGAAGAINQDQLEDQAARAAVQTGMATRYGVDEGDPDNIAGGISTGLRQWGGVAMSAISPLQNTVQGFTDMASEGGIGDESAAYYAEEQPGWVKALGIGAALGDAVFQFASPIGQAAFMGATGASIVGGVGQLSTMGGGTFDDRRGTFDSPDDAGQWMAAIGAVGVDAVSMLGARGIGKAASNADDLITGTARSLDDAAEAGTRSIDDIAKAMQPTKPESIGGRTFHFDDAGNVTKVQRNLTILAPSEATMFLGARAKARIQQARQQPGAVTPESFDELLYKAAKDLDQGTNLAQSTLLNAFGEGTEEAAQSLLEPLSHGWDPDPQEIIDSYVMGAAMGAGMTLGSRIGKVGNDERQRISANVQRGLRTESMYSKSEWKALPAEEKQRASMVTPKIQQAVDGQIERTLRESTATPVEFAAGFERVVDAYNTAVAQDLANAQPGVEGTYMISGHQSADVPGNVVQTSLKTTYDLLNQTWQGLREQITVQQDPAIKADLQAALAEAEALNERLVPLMNEATANERPELRADAVAQINQILSEAWDSTTEEQAAAGQYSPLARAVSVVLSRDPNDNKGSFQMLKPEVLLSATEANERQGNNGLLQVGSAVLKAISGDFDGDMMRVRTRLDFDPALYIALRTGRNILGDMTTGAAVRTRTSEEAILFNMSQAIYRGGSDAERVDTHLTRIELWLNSAFASISGIQELSAKFSREARQGDPEAKTNLINALSTTQYATEFQELSVRGTPVSAPLTNLVFAIDTRISMVLQQYRDISSPRTNDTVNTTGASFIPATHSYAKLRGVGGVTPAHTLHMSTAGVDAFRDMQKIYYDGYRSEEWSNATRPPGELDGFVAFYSALNSGMSKSAREEVLAGDELGKTALRMLKGIADGLNMRGDTPAETMVQIAALPLPDYRLEADGSYSFHGQTTIAQYVLRESAQRLQRDAGILQATRPEDLLEYRLAENMAPGDAIGRLFDQGNALTLMGEAGNNFDPRLTYAQIKAQYRAKNPRARRDYRNVVNSDFRMRQGKRHDFPYTWEELETPGGVTPYKVLMQAAFESVDAELSYDPNTERWSGSLVRSDLGKTEDLMDSLSKSREEIRNLAKLYRVDIGSRKDGINAQALTRMLDQNPDYARHLVELLPLDITPVILTVREDGRVDLPQWFLEMLVTDSPREAAMLYFKHTLLAKLNANGASRDPLDSDDRLIQLILKLQEEPLRLAQFNEFLFNATSIEGFLADVNRTFTDGPPQLAWYRDAARFDPSRTQGGWSRQLPGSELRESLDKFAGATSRFSAFVTNEVDLFHQENLLIQQLETELEQAAKGRQSSVEKIALLQSRLEQSSQLLRGLGPGATLRGPVALLHGMIEDSTDKGTSAKDVVHYGAADARGDSIIPGIAYEQALAQFTAADADDVASNATSLSNRSARLIDRNGREIKWEVPNAAKFVELYKDPVNRPMLRAMFYPSVYELQSDGNLRQQLLANVTLEQYINNDVYASMLTSKSYPEKMQYASMLDALSTKFGGHYEFSRVVSDVAQARLGGRSRQMNPEEYEHFASEIAMQIVDVVRLAGELSGAELADAINTALDDLQGATIINESNPVLRKEMEKALVAQLTPDLPTDASQDQLDEALAAEQLLLDFFKRDTFQRVISRFMIDWDDAQDVSSKKKMMYDLVRGTGGFASKTGEPVLNQLSSLSSLDPTGSFPMYSDIVEMDQDFWNDVSRAFAGLMIQTSTADLTARVRTPALPKDVLKLEKSVNGQLERTAQGMARYYDPSYRYLVDPFLAQDSPLLMAAREFSSIVKQSSRDNAGYRADEFFDSIGRLLDPQEYGPWNSIVARRSIEAQNRMFSSGSSDQVKRAGILYDKKATVMAAYRRTTEDPGAGLTREYMINGAVLNNFLETGAPDNLFDENGLLGAKGPESLVILNGRFLSGATLSYTNQAGERKQIDLLSEPTIKAGDTWAGGDTHGYKVTTVKKLRASVNSAIPAGAKDLQVSVNMFHPEDQPSDARFANSVIFEGTIYEGIADDAMSLQAAAYMGLDGFNKREQRYALDASKKGKLALRNSEQVSLEDVEDLQDVGNVYRTLRNFANKMFELQVGHEKLDPSIYSSVFKDLKSATAIRFVQDGKGIMLSAEEAIALQAGGTQLPDNAEFHFLSARDLNTILGEQGRFGHPGRIPSKAYTLDLSGVAKWEGSFQRLVETNLPTKLTLNMAGTEFETGDITATALNQQGHLQQLVARPPISRADIEALKNKITSQLDHRRLVLENRNKRPDFAENYKTALHVIMNDAKRLNQIPHLALRDMGISLDLPVGVDPFTDPSILSVVFQKLREVQEVDENAAGWLYDHGSSNTPGTRETGTLHGISSLDDRGNKKEAKGIQPVRGDLVVVQLETFGDRTKDVAEVINRLTDLGVTISLTHAAGGRVERNEAAAAIAEAGYVPISGSRNLWRPPELSDRTSQTMEAYYSRIAETYQLSPENFAVMFHSNTVHFDENHAVANDIEGKTDREVLLKRSMSPTSAWDNFNIAATSAERAAVKAQLDQINNSPEMLEHLVELSMNEEWFKTEDSESRGRLQERRTFVKEELARAIDRAARMYDPMTGRPRVGETFAPGDLLVLVGPRGNLIFSRHGYEPINDSTSLQEQLEIETPASWNGKKIAVYGPDARSNSTTYTGRIVEWDDSSATELSVVQSIPLQALGNKVVLQRNGMKYVVTSIEGSGIDLPVEGPIAGWMIDYIVNYADTVSKQSTDGLIDTAQNAITYLGMDFVQPLVKTFIDPNMTAEEWSKLTPPQQRGYRDDAYNLLARAGDFENHSIPAVLSLQKSLQGDQTGSNAALAVMLNSTSLEALVKTDVGTLLQDGARDPEAEVALAMMTYMLYSSASPEHVMSSPGFANLAPGEKTNVLPELFTTIFDNAASGSALEAWFFDRLNERLNNTEASAGVRQTGYVLRPDYTVVIQNEDPTKTLEGYLQFSQIKTAGANPTMQEMAEDRRGNVQLSVQQTRVAEETLGRAPLFKKLLRKGDKVLKREGLVNLETKQDLYTLLQGGNIAKERTTKLSRMLTGNELRQMDENYDAMREFMPEIDRSERTDRELRDRNALARRIIQNELGWEPEYEYFLDSWVRMEAASPKKKNPDSEGAKGNISHHREMEALQRILANLVDGNFPTTGFPVGAISATELTLFWNSSVAQKGDWRLQGITSFDGFVKVALGSLLASNNEPAFKNALNGYLNTYRDLGEDFATMPISRDIIEQLKLLDPTTNRMVIALDPVENDELHNATIADTYTVGITEAIEGQKALTPAASGWESMRRWRASSTDEIAVPIARTNNQILEGKGSQFVTDGTGTTALVRTLLNIRGALVMLNPLLHIASLGELWQKNLLESTTAIVTGTGSGAGQKAMGQLLDKNFDLALFQRAEATIDAVARNKKFSSMVNIETVPKSRLNNAGMVERITHQAMELGGRWQDASYGIRPKSLSRRYIESALRELQQRPELGLDPMVMLDALGKNPEWLRTAGYTDLHRAGIKTIENVRSLTPSALTLMFRGALDPLTNSPKMGRNLVANLGLKLPLMFAPFALNMTTNILGLQGLNAVALIALQGGQNARDAGGKRFGHLQAKLQGVEYDSSIHGIDFLEAGLDSVNLANAFIKGGLTHTSLMGLGLLAGSLGLTGEDEEEKRLRREAEVQGAGYVYDPRKIENDFRNADALFLDNLPGWFPFRDFLAESFETSMGADGETPSAMANLHWTLKMYASPIMGIERFLSTGNINQVTWGFQDALGSMPLVNAAAWDDTVRVGDELYKAALDAEASGSPEKTVESYGLVLNIVSQYERMLLESSFINGIYTAQDKYDRNPWTMADVGQDGTIIRDQTGVPMQTQALQQYLSDDGVIKEGKPQYDWFQGQTRTMAENRATLAFFGSLFTGSFGTNRSMMRGDMVVQEKKIEKNDLENAEASALIMSLWDPENKRETLTREGAEAIFEGLRMGSVRVGDPALENVFVTFEQRKEIQESLLAAMMQESLDLGLGYWEAKDRVNAFMYGSSTNPNAVPLADVIWNRGKFEEGIPYESVTRYRQLNTTYVMGPNGKPWATGVARGTLNNFFGMAPLQRYNAVGDTNLAVDEKLNSVDEMANNNTGMRSLERVDESWANPTDEDVIKAIEEGIAKVTDAIREAGYNDEGNGYGAGGGGRGRSYSRGGGGRGGGGGGGYGARQYPYKIQAPVRNESIYARQNPWLKLDDPIIRRATIRRERYSSTRGRLNQWQ